MLLPEEEAQKDLERVQLEAQNVQKSDQEVQQGPGSNQFAQIYRLL